MELWRRLWERIEPMWSVDFHSHIPIGRESAGSMARLLCYHYSETDAMNAGMSYQDYISLPTEEERARLLVRYFPETIGTTTHAGLHEVAEGLFGFRKRITPETWDELCELADEAMSKPGWKEEVLRKDRIAWVFGTNDPFEPLEGAEPWYQVCLRLDRFLLPDEHPLPSTVSALEELTGREVRGLSDFLDGLEGRFRYFKEKGAVSVAVSLPPDFSLEGGPTSPDVVFRKLMEGLWVPSEEMAALKAELFYSVLELCRKYGMVLQLMLGVVRKVRRGVEHRGDGLSQDPGMFRTFWEPLNLYPDVLFDFTVLSLADQHQLCVLVKNFPNAVCSGLWWYCNTPSIAEQVVRMRLEILGVRPQNGQNTDAYMLEQGYYKMRQYKRALSRALASMVEDNFFSEEEAVEVARKLLFENPIRHFGLDRSRIEEQITKLGGDLR